MLIRLCGHPKKNSDHVDKLIVINGLPDEMLYVENKGERSVAQPWEADVDVNIPKYIRHLCTPTEVTYRFPPIEKGAEPVVDKRVILGLKLDFQTQPGLEMWARIERILDNEIPRGEKIPEPVRVAEDMRKPFNLTADDIPVVDLLPKPPRPPTIPPPPVPSAVKEEPAPTKTFDCECGKKFPKEQGLKMHKMKTSHGKVPVTV